VPGSLTATHFTGDLDRATEPQQFFCQCGFTGIRVRNNGEGATALDFLLQTGHEKIAAGLKAAILTYPTCLTY
jgi:hypothetical protein